MSHYLKEYKKKKTEEKMRNFNREMNRQERRIQRSINQTEKKIQQNKIMLKKAMDKNDSETVSHLATLILQDTKAKSNLLTTLQNLNLSKNNVSAVNNSMQMADVLSNTSKNMKMVSNVMDTKSITKSAVNYQKEAIKLDTKREMIEDALKSVDEVDSDEERVFVEELRKHKELKEMTSQYSDTPVKTTDEDVENLLKVISTKS